MMPHTVPNRPMKGPAEPTVASTSRRRSSRSISRAMVTSITFSMRVCRPANERGLPSKLRFHSRIAATNSAAMEWRRPRRQRAVELLQRLARPERLFEAVHGALGARVEHDFVDRDRPHPDRAGEQPDHDRLDDPVRLPEQAEQREIGRAERRLRHAGRVHAISSRLSQVLMTGAARSEANGTACQAAWRWRAVNPENSRISAVHRRPTSDWREIRQTVPRSLPLTGRDSVKAW